MMDDNERAAREIAKVIQEFRQEFFDRVRSEFEAEVQKVEDEGFDPARGRGRGPKWADGA